ncbi:unnamed protein product [Amoebophrya sp. A25]|nr:unnamed protein product [Amoebophrya sp. A25]|eukprot:GSA25T00022477001.1
MLHLVGGGYYSSVLPSGGPSDSRDDAAVVLQHFLSSGGLSSYAEQEAKSSSCCHGYAPDSGSTPSSVSELVQFLERQHANRLDEREKQRRQEAEKQRREGYMRTATVLSVRPPFIQYSSKDGDFPPWPLKSSGTSTSSTEVEQRSKDHVEEPLAQVRRARQDDKTQILDKLLLRERESNWKIGHAAPKFFDPAHEYVVLLGGGDGKEDNDAKRMNDENTSTRGTFASPLEKRSSKKDNKSTKATQLLSPGRRGSRRESIVRLMEYFGGCSPNKTGKENLHHVKNYIKSTISKTKHRSSSARTSRHQRGRPIGKQDAAVDTTMRKLKNEDAQMTTKAVTSSCSPSLKSAPSPVVVVSPGQHTECESPPSTNAKSKSITISISNTSDKELPCSTTAGSLLVPGAGGGATSGVLEKMQGRKSAVRFSFAINDSSNAQKLGRTCFNASPSLLPSVSECEDDGGGQSPSQAPFAGGLTLSIPTGGATTSSTSSSTRTANNRLISSTGSQSHAESGDQGERQAADLLAEEQAKKRKRLLLRRRSSFRVLAALPASLDFSKTVSHLRTRKAPPWRAFIQLQRRQREQDRHRQDPMKFHL